ncbi:MAG: hypothetical protein ACYDAQ_05690 [Mycobacteriales bacterium]
MSGEAGALHFGNLAWACTLDENDLIERREDLRAALAIAASQRRGRCGASPAAPYIGVHESVHFPCCARGDTAGVDTVLWKP